ncbi:MAG: hypothetical protein JWN04_6108 [Myxococcaceae bacterium]|nr:hypothetical protein [Myxococcaceae bacterium]
MPFALLFALVLLAACQKSPASQPDSEGSAALQTSQLLDAGVSVDAGPSSRVVSASQVDGGPPLEFVGVVRGIVKLAKGAKVPLAPFPQLNGLTPPSVEPCPTPDATDQRSVTLSKQTGGLFPIHVALTGMTGAPKREPVTHDVFIDACRLRPTLVGAMRGDQVRITNRSEMPLVPRLPGASFMRGLMHGDAQQGPLKQTRTTIDCNFGSYCGESLVIATTHPLYAVTSQEGFFAIEQVPLDQDLKIHAWNPLFEVTSAPFRLSHEQPEQMIELTLTPTAAAAATKSGPPKPLAAPKVIVQRVDGGIIVDSPGPAYE